MGFKSTFKGLINQLGNSLLFQTSSNFTLNSLSLCQEILYFFTNLTVLYGVFKGLFLYPIMIHLFPTGRSNHYF